jgi:hypothetical protein
MAPFGSLCGASRPGRRSAPPESSVSSRPCVTGYPDALVLVIVSMAEPSSVANDRVILANGASPRQEG